MGKKQSDEEQIVELIHRNRIAMWTNDFDLWETCFVHEPYLVRWGWWRVGGIFVRTGWEDISARLKADMPPYREDFAYKTTVENLTLQIRGDVAWASFAQQYPGHELSRKIGPGLVHELRIFERVGGEWKIALLGILDGNGTNDDDDIVVRLSASGEITWLSPKALATLADSDDLVIRNGRLRFRDARVDRRLQEAVKWAAAQDRGFMSSHAAMPIAVDAGDELPMRIYWVVMDAGQIFFSFADEGVNAERLDMAALIYSLSPAQKEVAALVAEGLSLPEIAERMQISANTARTHLQRVFDKTGVRTQSALVRVLLSAAPPL